MAKPKKEGVRVTARKVSAGQTPVLVLRDGTVLKGLAAVEKMRADALDERYWRTHERWTPKGSSWGD